MLQISNLLLHSEDVPPQARAALATATQAPAEQRCENLFEAATILHYEVGLDCDDARELVGLDTCRCEDGSEEG
jgi:hypothetical protein